MQPPQGMEATIKHHHGVKKWVLKTRIIPSWYQQRRQRNHSPLAIQSTAPALCTYRPYRPLLHPRIKLIWLLLCRQQTRRCSLRTLPRPLQHRWQCAAAWRRQRRYLLAQVSANAPLMQNLTCMNVWGGRQKRFADPPPRSRISIPWPNQQNFYITVDPTCTVHTNFSSISVFSVSLPPRLIMFHHTTGEAYRSVPTAPGPQSLLDRLRKIMFELIWPTAAMGVFRLVRTQG